MSHLLSKLSNELWIEIASYGIGLNDFIRLWMSCKVLYMMYDKKDNQFWKNLLEFFLTTHGLSSDIIKRRIQASSAYLFLKSSIANDIGSDGSEAFNTIRQLCEYRKCSRSGCYKLYQEWSNNDQACSYHPGRAKSGQVLSCCRGKGFDSPGCKLSSHSGIFHIAAYSKREKVTTEPKTNRGMKETVSLNTNTSTTDRSAIHEPNSTTNTVNDASQTVSFLPSITPSVTSTKTQSNANRNESTKITSVKLPPI